MQTANELTLILNMNAGGTGIPEVEGWYLDEEGQEVWEYLVESHAGVFTHPVEEVKQDTVMFDENTNYEYRRFSYDLVEGEGL